MEISVHKSHYGNFEAIFLIFDCQLCIVAVAIKMSYNCCYIPKQPSPPSQVFIFVLPVSVYRSISGHPCVWSGTEPVVGDEPFSVFSSFKCFLAAFLSSLCSSSASRAQTLSQRPVGALAAFHSVRLSVGLCLISLWWLVGHKVLFVLSVVWSFQTSFNLKKAEKKTKIRVKMFNY